MRQEDLMLGDFVQDKSDQSIIQIKTHWDIYNAKEFDPVPITPEMMKPNGFIYVSDNEWKSEDGVITIMCENNMTDREWTVSMENEFFQTLGFAELAFVHELQHALRLCGIEKEIKL